MSKKKPAALDPLDALVAGPIERVLQLMLWKNRHQAESMTLVIKPEDIKGLDDCAEYLRATPAVVVIRPEGRPAVPPVPATASRSGRPGIPAEAPRNHVVVALVNKGTMDAIRPLENNDEDAQRMEAVRDLKRWRDRAGQLAMQAAGMASSGDTSTATLNEISQCLQAFANSGHQ